MIKIIDDDYENRLTRFNEIDNSERPKAGDEIWVKVKLTHSIGFLNLYNMLEWPEKIEGIEILGFDVINIFNTDFENKRGMKNKSTELTDKIHELTDKVHEYIEKQIERI